MIVGGVLANAAVQDTRRLYDLGVGGSFDVWSIHPYALDRSPLQHDYAYPQASPIDGVPQTRALMVARGDGHKSLWLTELGHSTCSVRNSSVNWENCVSEADQALYAQQYVDLIQTWPYVGVATYYEVIDMGGSDTRLNRYGLIRPDGSRKPAFWAFRDAQ